jgi:uncharacterized SAM-binding protein YcdF (DUF218 family)
MTEPPTCDARTTRPDRRLGGIFVRRERWTLCRPAKLLLAAGVLGLVLAAKQCLYSFLAVSDAGRGDCLVVEGWVPPYCLKAAAAIAKTGGYRKTFATGCRALEEWGAPVNTTYAELGAERLIALGVGKDLVQAVPSRVERKDRTYNSALALKEWCASNNMPLKSMDVVTLGPHARRSRLLFQKAFGNDVSIGIIAVEAQTYEPARWWASSEGVREVIGEGIAYLYARLLFHPSEPASRR